MARSVGFSVIVLLLLAGCASQPGPRLPAPRGGEVTVSPKLIRDIRDLLKDAERAEPETAAELRLQAAEIAVSQRNGEQAKVILDAIGPIERPDLLKRYFFARARIALLDREAIAAIHLLDNSSLLSIPMTEADQVTLGRIRAEAYDQSRSFLASARERIFIDKLLDDGAKAENHDLIFASLMELPADTLSARAESAITSDVRGWLSLAAMARRYQNDPLQQLVELNKWKKVWSYHPAAVMLPANLRLLSQVVEDQPRAIALMLPLQGDLAPFGRAIRDGILAAHYNVADQVQIRVYDTSAGNITSVIDRARFEGAELAIGPLDREKVTELALSGPLPMTVLALNRTLDGSVNPDLYQFGLAPEDEVTQVAEQVYSEGKRNALVIYPTGEWGDRNFETFRNRWLALGGNLVDTARYDRQRDYSDMVKGLLNVDESEKRARDVRRIIGQRFEFTPRRRQDIDFVFLLADADEARKINPTLAFFYAEDIPVYSTSPVHAYSVSRINAIDLNGIRFCDIPWKLTSTDKLQTMVQKLWPAAEKELAPFYALGVDAYRLYPRLRQIKQVRGAKLFGTTGVLRLDENNVVTRRLMWARFQDGEAISMPMIVEAPAAE